MIHRTPSVRHARHLSKQRAWALDLRLSLLVLFGLVWVAQRAGTGVLVAGFGVGLMVAAIGGPKRLSRQVTGVAQGLMVPLFFVVLGARLDLRALARSPVADRTRGGAARCSTSSSTLRPRSSPGSQFGAGLAATAQLGVPAAVVTLGLQQQILTSGEAAAIVAAALGSLALTAVGVTLLGTAAPKAAAAEAPSPSQQE